jgi:hypothetical protein
LVAKFLTIQVLLALTTKLDLELHQVDIKTEFLTRELEEEIYMHLPPGFQKGKTVVWQLKKSLYGLKQASRNVVH